MGEGCSDRKYVNNSNQQRIADSFQSSTCSFKTCTAAGFCVHPVIKKGLFFCAGIYGMLQPKNIFPGPIEKGDLPAAMSFRECTTSSTKKIAVNIGFFFAYRCKASAKVVQEGVGQIVPFYGGQVKQHKGVSAVAVD